MYKKSDDQLLMMQDTIDANRQDSDEKMRKQDYKLDKLMAMVENMMNHIQTWDYLPDSIDSPKAQYPALRYRLTRRPHHWRV